MKPIVAVAGAGGKTGMRSTNRMVGDADHKTLCCETGAAGLERLRQRGVPVMLPAEALPKADRAIFAVPDAAMAAETTQYVALMEADAVVVLRDPVSAVAGEAAIRNDLDDVVCHPCHLPLFRQWDSAEARKDLFGGVSGKDDLVLAVLPGNEERWVRAEALWRRMLAPVETVQRITVEQMAILGSAMAEVVAATAAVVMREALEEAVKTGVPPFMHGNWRSQRPIRELGRALRENGGGQPFRPRISCVNRFPVFETQFLSMRTSRFILPGMGPHVFDNACLLFGRVLTVAAWTRRINPEMVVEEVAPAVLETKMAVVCELSYAGRIEHDRFPETFVHVVCERASVELGPDFWVHVTTGEETRARRMTPSRDEWTDPHHAVVHASMADCRRDLLATLKRWRLGETRAKNGLRSLHLVFKSYRSAKERRTIPLYVECSS